MLLIVIQNAPQWARKKYNYETHKYSGNQLAHAANNG